MHLPVFIKEKVEEDQKLSAFLYGAITRFEIWISDSHIPFFREYTDHSIKHVEEVLQTTVDLMTEEAKQVITSMDAVALTLGVCLHDSGMHLLEDGFQTLIRKECKWKSVIYFDSISWHELWLNFLSDAKRYDGKKLKSLFGDSEPIRIPPKKIIDYSDRDKLLIGEFIRIHHPRLAHEIALFGVPSADGESYNIFQNDDYPELIDFSGLIARSHGMDLRNCVDYLKEKRAQRDYNGLHVVYLMSLLRIADFLQIQPQRADHKILEIRKLKSPVSNSHWAVHKCIKNISHANEDPEAVEINATPENVETYLLVSSWLSGIQAELDLTWAVLGEVYGLYAEEKLNDLTLNLRRIRSNLDEKKEFASSVSFIPEKIQFSTANADLLKLLVEPLYGDVPLIGLRELIQNAVDAVREFQHLCDADAKYKNLNSYDLPTDVLIEIEINNEELPTKISITDKGVGMDVNVVKNYFLTAGASYRKSLNWKKNFEDEESNSKILRSGRFGVGALAAFLLGDKIQVITRSINAKENDALRFKTKIDDNAINLERISAPVGTSISISIPEAEREKVLYSLNLNKYLRKSYTRKKNVEEFDFDSVYYLQDEPSLSIKLKFQDVKERLLTAKDIIPSINSKEVYPWIDFDSEGYEKIYWSYNFALSRYHNNFLICNGIFVTDSNYIYDDLKGFKRPSLSVYDPNGNLPLNLQRTELTRTKVSFKDDLETSILDNFLTYCLLSIPCDDWDKMRDWLFGDYIGFNRSLGGRRYSESSRWSLYHLGVTYRNENLINQLQIDNNLVFYTSTGKFPYKGEALLSLAKSLGKNQVANAFGEFRVENYTHKMTCTSLLDTLDVSNSGFTQYDLGRRIAVRKNDVEYAIGRSRKKMHRILQSIELEKEINEWCLYRIGSCPAKPNWDFDNRLMDIEHHETSFVGEYYYNKANTVYEKADVLKDRWNEVIQKNYIPFNKLERDKILNSLNEDFDIHITDYQKYNEQKKKIKINL